MARPSNEQKLANIHATALAEFDKVQSALREERLQCLQDRRFYSIAGAQWEGALGDQFENKPRFEFNTCHLAVIRLFSEYRNNRVTVDFTTKDGSDDDEMADACDGLYRADEKASSAEEAYDNAFEEGVGGGFGAWRLRACYEDEDDDENDAQRIEIEPIHDADSCVWYDIDAKRQDKRDATRCWVLTPYSPGAYKEEWNDDPATWPKGISQRQFDWATPDVVWVAEYYVVEEVRELVQWYRGLALDSAEPNERKVTQAEIDADPELLTELEAMGFRLSREKRIERKRVHKYLMSGAKILEDCGFIAGKWIPIVPFFAKRWVVDGIERCMGHVRLAKDAQRLNNALLSWLAEMASRFDIEKPILSPEQIAGHATMWAEDNVKKYPYLLANNLRDENGNPVPGSNAPAGYTKAPNIPPAMAALVQIAQQALTDLLGNQQAGEQLQPNLSGKAVELIQTRLDMQVFIYMSNFAKAMKRCGEVWLSMKKELTVEESRAMKTIDAQGKNGTVTVNEPAYDAESAQQYTRNDMTKANFDVDVDVGPSSNSLRSSVVRALTGIATITDDPQTKQALTLATIAHIEGEGLGDLREWARRQAVRLGLVKPTDEEALQLQQDAANQQPDPQSQYLQAAAAQAAAKAEEAKAGTLDTLAAADLKKAQTAKTWADAGVAHTQQALNVSDVMARSVQPPADPLLPES
jgi:hypothetical protein